MPADPKNISRSIEEIQNKAGYRKRYASIFSASGGKALARIDLKSNWVVVGISDAENILLINMDEMDGVANFTICVTPPS